MLNKMKFWKTSRTKVAEKDRITSIMQHQIPSHIAIIMDGNGRWAKKRALPRIAGHHEGMRVVKKITKLANRLGVKTLTLYAFSTENWKRPKQEVDYLMKLPEEFLGSFLPELNEENVKVCMMGYRDQLPQSTRNAVEKAIETTSQNTGLILNFALNYGSRAEMIEAIKDISLDLKNGEIKEHDINEETFSNYLMTKDLPDPDLLIRTSGELRLSNFLLWQLAYTELWFTDVLWPDFTENDLVDAIEAFQRRSRRWRNMQRGDRKMKERIISAVVAIAVFLPIAIWGGWAFLLLAYAMATIGLIELFKMRKYSLVSGQGVISLILLWIILMPQQYFDVITVNEWTKMEVMVVAVLLFLSYTVIVKNHFTFDDAGFSLISVLYLGIGFYYFVETREAGLVYLLYALLVVWVTDSGAYFVGRAVGKRKLWPELALKKQ